MGVLSVIQPSDEALLAGMATGDERASVEFVRRYRRRVFGLAYSMIGDADASQDVAQEAMLRVWRHAQVFDARRGSVTTWVLSITRNLAIDFLRLRRATPTDPDHFGQLGLVSLAQSPEDRAQTARLGRERAETFTWARCVDQHLVAYHRARGE